MTSASCGQRNSLYKCFQRELILNCLKFSVAEEAEEAATCVPAGQRESSRDRQKRLSQTSRLFCLSREFTMSTESLEMMQQPQLVDGAITALASDNSTESESDGGYGTPAESFADDERPPTPPAVSPLPSATVTETRGSPSDELVVVDPELRERIKNQVEYYFSDENLLKDSFLMKHVNRNRLGYVSLKLVASLRKVKSLTKDWRVVLASVRHSDKLALNEDENKIRRLAPPPQVDYSHVTRTVLVSNYPSSEPGAKEVEEAFAQYGEVTLVRIIHPGKAIPLDVKPCRGNHPVLGSELCILVEYESIEGARVACSRFRGQQSWRDRMRVELLDDQSPHSTQEVEKTHKPLQEEKRPRNRRQKNEGVDRKGNQSGKEGTTRSYSASPQQSRAASPTKQLRDFQKKHGAKCSPELSRKFLHPEAWRDYASDSGCSSRSSSQSPKGSPEPPLKRPSVDISPSSWRRHVHVKDSGLVRQPLGPDGSRGFQRHRESGSVRISVDSC